MTFTLDGIEYAFRWCPPGNFTMGSPKNEFGHQADQIQVNVELTSGFWMQETTVTQSMWQTVMGTQPWQAIGFEDYVKVGANYPATYVAWSGATEFAAKLTATARQSGVLPASFQLALPTEARWEYACRAETVTMYSFGDDFGKLGKHAWYNENAYDIGETYAHEVGQKQPTRWGLLDMHGNVWEWCQDYHTWVLEGGRDPHGPASGSNRVIRGDCWFYSGLFATSSSRNRCKPDIETFNHGVRLAQVQEFK